MNHPGIKLWTILLICGLMIVLGCTKDENPVRPTQNGLPGQWELQKLTIETENNNVVMDEEQLTEMGIIWSLKFKINKSFKYTSNVTGATTVEQGFWKTYSDTLELVFYNGNAQKLYYSQVENDLVLKWQGYEDGVQEDFTAELYRPVAD